MDEQKKLLTELKAIFDDFDKKYTANDIRGRILSLVPAFDTIRELGKSIIPDGNNISARNRLLKYFLAYPKVILNEKELAIVAGISEWARRVRELRVEHGWKIITGVTAEEMLGEDEFTDDDIEISDLGPNDYVLLDSIQDRDAAYRWNVANEVRKRKDGSKEKVLAYLRANINKSVTGEELAYVAKSSEWARRVRELRTEEGWPIVTKLSGNPNLPVGVYVLEADRQAPIHDRKITESTRRETLRRDNYCCQNCGWNHDMFNRSDPRFLELHHQVHHKDKGSNEMDNLTTLCNICHDEIHKMDKNA